jgi:hypothetical protein
VIHFNNTVPPTTISLKTSLPLRFPLPPICYEFIICCTLVSCPAHPLWFDHSNKILYLLYYLFLLHHYHFLSIRPSMFLGTLFSNPFNIYSVLRVTEKQHNFHRDIHSYSIP